MTNENEQIQEDRWFKDATIRTVGALIDALEKFPRDAPVFLATEAVRPTVLFGIYVDAPFVDVSSRLAKRAVVVSPTRVDAY